MIKQRTESIDVYKKNNREDLLKIEVKMNIKYYRGYLAKTIKRRRNKKNMLQ